MVYVQELKDPSKSLVLEEATLSWRKTGPGVVNGALELEKNGYAAEGMTRAQPPPGALPPQDKGDSRAPELHKINLVVSKVTSSGPPDFWGLRLGDWPGTSPFPWLKTAFSKSSL